MTEGDKYPPKIQKLFTPRLPFVYKKPCGYLPEHRKTARITPLKGWKSIIDAYKQEHGKKVSPKPETASGETPSESKERQMKEWEDTETFNKKEFLKDPYRTVFVARLHYSVGEIDLSKALTQFGAVESIRVVRNTKTGLSRGYAFVVFENEVDAKNCVRELAPTGIVVKSDEASRKALVDTERGRLVRNWLPRRLGGGLGGRNYLQPSTSHLREASAAASGRRLNLSSNPYQSSGKPPPPSRFQKRPHTDRFVGPNKRQTLESDSFAAGEFRYSQPEASSPQKAFEANLPLRYTSTSAKHSVQSVRSTDTSIKDKYAKYQSVGSTPGDDTRSTRNIRR